MEDCSVLIKQAQKLTGVLLCSAIPFSTWEGSYAIVALQHALFVLVIFRMAVLALSD